jgi:hypothetical protein
MVAIRTDHTNAPRSATGRRGSALAADSNAPIPMAGNYDVPKMSKPSGRSGQTALHLRTADGSAPASLRLFSLWSASVSPARLLPSPVMTAAGAWSLIPAAAPASPVFATVCRSLTAGLSAAAKERMCRDASPLTAPSG